MILLGIGLQTAFNMVRVMGGDLDCSTSDVETVFWFTVNLEVKVGLYGKEGKRKRKRRRRRKTFLFF